MIVDFGSTLWLLLLCTNKTRVVLVLHFSLAVKHLSLVVCVNNLGDETMAANCCLPPWADKPTWPRLLGREKQS